MASRAVVRRSGSALEKVVKQQVKPIVSTDLDQARSRMHTVYKAWMRYAPEMHFRYDMTVSLPAVRLAIKNQFLRYASITDPRAIDMLVHNAEVELNNTRMTINQKHHVMSALFGETINKRPRDFLGKFFAGKV